jgi:hypothetical protein
VTDGVAVEHPVRLTVNDPVAHALAVPDPLTDPVTESLAVWGEGDGLRVPEGEPLTLTLPEVEPLVLRLPEGELV